MSEETHSLEEEDQPTTRPLNTNERKQIPADYRNPYYSLTNQCIEATWNKYPVYSKTGKFPWTIRETGQQITTRYYEREYPGYEKLEDFNYQILGGLYHNKKVRWNNNKHCWQYLNNQNIEFSDSESDPEETTKEQEGETSTSAKPQDQESDNQAEVSQLLESTTKKISELISQVSRPQTPQTVPGALPVTPAQTTQVQLPTPTATTALPPTLPPARAPSPTLWKALAVPLPRTPPVIVPPLVLPVVVPAPPVVPNPPMAGVGGSTKILGAAPEPFEGKPEKAEAFWNNLENYFYLNEDVFNTDGKKISSALTYFKIGTSAREWAQDLQKKALARTPITFGMWAMFKDGFKKHFIPAHSALEATNAMYTSKMGGRPFNEWYQDWSTYASRSGANKDTQMFAFRKALPMALHQKIMGVSPQPTTLEGLVEKAHEFDHLWHMYSNPAFTRNSGPRNRALTTEEDHIQANVAQPHVPRWVEKYQKKRRTDASRRSSASIVGSRTTWPRNAKSRNPSCHKDQATNTLKERALEQTSGLTQQPLRKNSTKKGKYLKNTQPKLRLCTTPPIQDSQFHAPTQPQYPRIFKVSYCCTVRQDFMVVQFMFCE
jgi:hypothetical protein